MATPSALLASKVDPDALRVVGSICGAGLSADVQGEFDASIARVIGATSAVGAAAIDVGQLSSLLEQFSNDEQKNSALRMHVQCIVQVVSALSGAQPNGEIEVAVDGLLVPDPLSIIKPQQQFKMKIGETRFLNSQEQLLTLLEGKEDGAHVKITHIPTKQNWSGWWKRGFTSADFLECSVTPYSFDEAIQAVSFIYSCKMNQ